MRWRRSCRRATSARSSTSSSRWGSTRRCGGSGAGGSGSLSEAAGEEICGKASDTPTPAPSPLSLRTRNRRGSQLAEGAWAHAGDAHAHVQASPDPGRAYAMLPDGDRAALQPYLVPASSTKSVTLSPTDAVETTFTSEDEALIRTSAVGDCWTGQVRTTAHAPVGNAIWDVRVEGAWCGGATVSSAASHRSWSTNRRARLAGQGRDRFRGGLLGRSGEDLGATEDGRRRGRPGSADDTAVRAHHANRTRECQR